MLVSSVFADTITLKNGDHLEGKITSETEKDVTMQVQISAGITDERVVPKTDIEKVEKVSPEVLAYRAIAGVKLGPDSLAPEQYEPWIQALQAFVTQYPDSTRAADVKTTLKAIQDEKKRTEGDQVKLDGQWLTRAEVEKNKIEIGARRAFAYMKSQSAAGDYVGAMNTFTAIEKTYPGAAVMPEAIDLAQKVVNQLKPMVTRAMANQKAFMADRQKGIAAAGPADRAQMTAAVKQEVTQGDEVVDAAVKAGNWPPLLPNNEKSLTALLAQVTKEGTRLYALPVDKMKQSLQLTEVAKQILASGDSKVAAEKLSDATKLWSANDLAKRLTVEVTSAEKAAAATPAPTMAAPAPERPAPATPKPKHTAPPPSASATAPTAPVATGSTDQANNDDDRPFIMTVPGIACAVVGLAAILAGANIYLKKKKARAEEAGIS
jgi:hypothetical protein